MSHAPRRGRAQRDHDAAPQGRTGPKGADRRHERSARTPAETANALSELFEPAVAAQGFDLEEIDVRPAGRRRLVRVVIDVDGGIGLDDIATVSQELARLLDDGDVMGSAPYVLEVTSPGVDRPLTEPRHWRRATGRLVRTALTAGGEIEGRVTSVDDGGVLFAIAAGRRGNGQTTTRRLGFEELGRGRVQVEFRRLDEASDQPAAADED
ncbi:ribosome maturation factor RimP [Actinomadura craniellae]|uniref:Ribosome maturation factor RimP n=1 Tax=Actinomadura craniellae TaxID=2231787 RepID=A0A365GYR7_9ACTN|nr:ribosome maturation factor RimP [Actinomadura craniellae]RAY11980.1 ribosome maturation factor RimP [Actinomadura craniellae]